MRVREFLSVSFLKKLPAEFGGERIWVTPRADIRVLKPGWDGAAYDLKLVVRNIVQEGMVVWDIGANQGILSFMAASKVGPQGAVYALEADPVYADLIFRSGQRLSKTYQKVIILCAAISERAGILEFIVSQRGHARSGLAGFSGNENYAGVSKMVSALSGDDLLKHWKSPNLIKIDVEGAECAALKGMKEILTVARPILYIEVSDQNTIEATKILNSYGYEIFHLKGSGEEEPRQECSFYTIARPKRQETHAPA